MKFNYLLLDVFTTRRFSGNPLAVVLRADGLTDDEMQIIAKEFGLSETVFLRKPKSERNAASVRIFTPQVELPFAGHPTVGAAVVLGLQGKALAIRIEEQVGLVTALFTRVDRRTAEARFTLPHLPEETGKAPDRRPIALALGIDTEEIGCGLYAPSVYSAGVPFYLIPVRDAGVLRRVEPQRLLWNQTFPSGHNSVYVFTETPDEPENDFAARMFSPGMGLGEDPGTGAAAAALLGLISKHTVFASGQADYRLRQGTEMGRPCLITLHLRKDDDHLTHAGIGGHAIVVGEGVLDLDD